MANQSIYDLIIIGAGPGGLTTALYASRADHSVLLLDRGIYGGNLNNTADIANYPGFESIKGADLAKKMYQSATQFGAEYAYGNVTKVEADGKLFRVSTDMDEVFQARTVVIATGSTHRNLDVPGEEKYAGRGVSYCAVCDGNFFKGQPLMVVGGGDSAVEEGTYLAGLASSVNVLVRKDKVRAQALLMAQAKKHDNMAFTYQTSVSEIVGDGQKVTGVKVKNSATGQEQTLPCAGVFIYVGSVPMTQPFANLGILDEAGWVKTDARLATAVPGIFAIGDVRETPLRQIATAVGDGALASQSVHQYLDANFS